MKNLFLLFLCCTFLFQSPHANASCDIKPLATRYLNDLYKYIDGGLERPKLKIDDRKLEPVDNTEIQQYKLASSQKKYYVTAYTQGNVIKIYSKIFKLHDRCDKKVKGKLRNILAHEYTHYLDSFGDVSKVINTTDDEETAIISEHVLSKLVWGEVKVQHTRMLTFNEQRKAVIMKNFFIENSH